MKILKGCCLKTSQVTYVTMVPRGNETLRRGALGNAISDVQLWIICVISQNWRPDVRCGWRHDQVMCSRRQLLGMKHSSSRDAGSMALRRSVSFPRGTMVSYVTWDVPHREHRAASRRFGERDVHATRISNPCLVCGMHSYGKRTEEPGVACRSKL